MDIGVIGAGRIGGTVSRLLARAGHRLYLSNSRGPDSLAGLVAEAGPTASAVTPQEAARRGEVVLMAMPWAQAHGAIPPELVAGKILIDAMNTFGGPAGDELTSSERLAAWYPKAIVVKAFNTMNFKVMERAAAGPPADRPALYVAGDDETAKRVVLGLIADIGFPGLDTGSLRVGGALQQSDGPLFNKNLSAERARQVLAAVSEGRA